VHYGRPKLVLGWCMVRISAKVLALGVRYFVISLTLLANIWLFLNRPRHSPSKYLPPQYSCYLHIALEGSNFFSLNSAAHNKYCFNHETVCLSDEIRNVRV
jgi:hypothetical protein